MNAKHFTDIEHTWATWTFAELLSVDTETTGLSPHHDRIVEIGAVRCQLGGARSVHCNQRFNPRRPIPPKVTAINGISDKDVAQSPAIGAWLPTQFELIDFARPRRLWIGNNADYDHSMIAAEMTRDVVGLRHWSPMWLDVKVLLKAIDGAARFDRGYRMAMMLPRFGLDYQGRAHSAVVDCHANLDLLEAMVRQYPKQLPSPAAALALQAHWLDTSG